MGGFDKKDDCSLCSLITLIFIISLIVMYFSSFHKEIKVTDNNQKIHYLCDKYSVNQVYDETEFRRFERVIGLTVEHETPIELSDQEEVKDILEDIDVNFDKEDKVTFLYLKKNKFLSYYLSNKRLHECRNSGCFISEKGVYDLSTKNLIYHVKDIKTGYGRADSCMSLKIGAFLKDK